jgi:hypothetical protein
VRAVPGNAAGKFAFGRKDQPERYHSRVSPLVKRLTIFQQASHPEFPALRDDVSLRSRTRRISRLRHG